MTKAFHRIISKISERHITSFRQKIFLMAVPLLIITSIVYTFEAVKTERSIMREEIIKKAEVVTELASHIGELPLISGNQEQMEKAVGTLRNVPEVSFVTFYSPDMTVLYKQPGLNIPKIRQPEGLEMSLTEKDDYFDLLSPVFTTTVREDINIFQETENSDEIKETVGWIRIGFSKISMKQAENSIIYRGLLIAVIFVIGSSALLFRMATTATKPLSMLSSAVQKIRKGIYTEIEINSTDEIGTLTSEFNRMSRTIKEREEMLVNKAHLFEFVAHIGIILTESENMTGILQHCTDIIIRHFKASQARIWIYNRDKRVLDLIASSGIDSVDSSPFNHAAVGEYEAGTTAQHRRSYYSNDIEKLHPGEREWAEQGKITSFAGYPLIVENRLVGVLEIFTANQITEDIFNTMDSVADEIALGIQHKLVEQQIKSSLSEKEVLLREVHHRVKNNMQVISSLLSLQSEQTVDKEYIDKFNDSKNRIKSMALVHEKLYQSKDLANIDFNDYVRTLAGSLFSFYEILTRTVSLNIDVEDIALGVDTAIPCGLLINEVLSNSLKHAFSNGSSGEINILFKKTDIEGKNWYDLIISDNGKGLPDTLDIRKTESLGLQLIITLVEHQLQGKLELERSSGTKFHFRFKEITYKKRI